MHILIVEDEPKLANLIKEALEQHDFTCDVAYDGMMGKKLASKNTYHLAILDIIIPYLSGIQLCREIRETNSTMPILFLTALGTTDDKVAGFDAGADDYLVKPFEIKELIARVKALTRRSAGFSEVMRELKVADLTLNLDRKIASRGDKTIELTAKEFALLEYLMRNKGRVLSRTIIAEKVWDIDFDTGTNVVDVYINFLRKKVDKEYEHKLIQTRIGSGYFLDDK
jgi:two-component system, OmpR family, copper resistance phosphate regulon response regulator CusR